MLRAWSGGPLTVAQISSLTGLPPDKGLYNALDYLRRKGACVRVGTGIYQPVNDDRPLEALGYENMNDADLIANLRQMAGFNHVGLITHLAANRLEALLSDRLNEGG